MSVVNTIPDGRLDKLQPKAIQKLVTRLLKQHSIDESACPNLTIRKNNQQLKYLLYKKYIEVSHDLGFRV